MIKYLTILFLFISLNGYGQTYLTVTAYKADTTKQNALVRSYVLSLQNQINALSTKVNETEKKLTALDLKVNKWIADSTFLYDPKTLAAPGGVLTVIGGGGGGTVPQKWIDSVNVVLKLNAIDIKQLYANDAAETKARSDSDKAIRYSLYLNDSLTKFIQVAMVSYYQIGLANNAKTNLRVDSADIAIATKVDKVDLIPIVQSIKDLTASDRELEKRIAAMELWSANVKQYFLTFPQK